ncbi:hypothetical protein NPIL_623041 [Nephila pilipes]|uniref:Uncharacterized protein n=1 Tax=Nephila pilipes TaxID=299642 RepID=A0A8X6I528_NEPPI|nr:hypothetical protein NPIL_623041 [Nephila pilipes]
MGVMRLLWKNMRNSRAVSLLRNVPRMKSTLDCGKDKGPLVVLKWSCQKGVENLRYAYRRVGRGSYVNMSTDSRAPNLFLGSSMNKFY